MEKLTQLTSLTQVLPIDDVDSQIHRIGLGYQKTLSLWGRTSNLRIEVPWADGTTKAAVEGEPGRRDVSGLGDVSMTLSVNLLGAPRGSQEGIPDLGVLDDCGGGGRNQAGAEEDRNLSGSSVEEGKEPRAHLRAHVREHPSHQSANCC